MVQGNVVDNMMAKLGVTDKEDFLKEARTSYPHISKMPTLRFNGQPRRFYEMKVDYKGQTVTTKIPITPENITSPAMMKMVDNPAEQFKTRIYDAKGKGLDRYQWDQHPDVIVDLTDENNKVTMPNPHYGTSGNQYSNKGKVITMDLEEALPYTSQFKEMKDRGQIDKPYLDELNDRYFQSTIAPQHYDKKLEDDLSFYNMQNARDVASTQPGLIKPQTVYRIGEQGKVYEVTGQQILDQAASAHMASDERATQRAQYQQTLLTQGVSEQRAKFLSEMKYGNQNNPHELQQLNEANNHISRR